MNARGDSISSDEAEASAAPLVLAIAETAAQDTRMCRPTATNLLALLPVIFVALLPGCGDSSAVDSRNIESAPASRVILFPAEQSMGVVLVRDWDAAHDWDWDATGRLDPRDGFPTWDEFGEARGEVEIPAGKEVCLLLQHTAHEVIPALATLGADDIQVIAFPESGGAFQTGWTFLPKTEGGSVSWSTPEGFSPAEIAKLKGLTGLKELYLRQSQVSDAALAELRTLRGLKVLVLSSNDISDAGVIHLEELKSLRYLELYGGRVTSQGLERLKKALPNCAIKHSVAAATPTPTPKRRPIS